MILTKIVKSNIVYSFDIFDTLLLRPFTDPQEVWKVLEEHENAHGFAKARKEADRKSYTQATKECRETTIAEAYDMMPRRFHGLMQKEMELERHVLTSNQEMLELWNELGQKGMRRVIISDMYLPTDFIQSVLTENGITGWDGFYLSSERNARKTTGKLFEMMLKEEDVKPSDILHIGDNEWSDVKIPRKLGINVRHYQKLSERLFDDFPYMLHVDVRLAGAMAIGWHQYKLEHPNHNYWNKLGFAMGGVLGYMYVSWIVGTAKELGINHLMFVARDGYILEKICNILYPEIRTDYFCAPRLTSIAVLGATGNDPVAIADRMAYMKEHLQNNNPEETKQSYSDYLQGFVLDDKTAIVDGCSSGFSAQRLVEETIGHPVFTFYLMAMAKMTNGAALFSSKLPALQFQNLSEFLFGAPTPPINRIERNGPVYETSVDDEEQFKMDVSDDILNGATSCAICLKKNVVRLKADDWLTYSNLFMENLTVEDSMMLDKARNAMDVQHRRYGVVIWTPQWNRPLLKNIAEMFYSFEGGYYVRRLKFFGITVARRRTKWWECDVKNLSIPSI